MKRYAVTMNSIQLVGWSMVLAGAVINYTHCPKHLLLLTLLVQLLNVYDLLLIINQQRPGPKLTWVLQNGARVLFVILLLVAQKYDVSFRLFYAIDATSILLIVWSLAEIPRFIFYLFKTPVFRWMRYSVFLVCYPAGVGIELVWIYFLFKGLPFLWAKIFLVILGIAYLFGFPYLFLHLFRSRQQKLKP